jgi:nitrogen regulatory protein PII-like uncharacterized protein
MAKPIAFNVQRLISAVAAEHRLVFKPDDAAFAIVTMNRLVLEESLEAIHSLVAADLAQFKETAQWAHSRAESAIEEEVRRSSRVIREELQRDLNNARLRAAEIVQEVRNAYEKPMSNRKFTIMVLAGLLLILCGIWVGRYTASW